MAKAPADAAIVATETPRPGLRERKSRRTRATIRSHAFRLFSEQGYASTTVAEIADAAEVSESTFFRYFGTKEDVVFRDGVGVSWYEAVKAQPTQLSPLETVRNAFATVVDGLTEEDVDHEREMLQLLTTTPELQAAMFKQIRLWLHPTAELLEQRGRKRYDPVTIQNLLGAVTGVMFTAMMLTAEDPANDWFSVFTSGLDHLARGFP